MKRLSLVASLALSLSSLISTSLVNARTPTIATSNRLAKHDSASEKQQQHTDSKRSEPTHSLVTTNRDHSIRRLKVDTAAGCFLDVSLTCTPKNNEAASCDDLFASAKASMCDFPATGFEFLFSGGNCDNSINMESKSHYLCRDFNGGPTSDSDDENYIVAAAPRRVGNQYFADTVKLGSVISLQDAQEGHTLMEEIMVMVYADSSMDTLLQLMIFKSSCQGDIGLGDDFGSIELVTFTNHVQQTMTSRATAMYEISIVNHATEETTLTDVVTLVDNVHHDLWMSLKGESIAPGKRLSIVEEMTVDLWSSVKEHYVTAFVSGEIPGHRCSSVGQIDIVWDVD